MLLVKWSVEMHYEWRISTVEEFIFFIIIVSLAIGWQKGKTITFFKVRTVHNENVKRRNSKSNQVLYLIAIFNLFIYLNSTPQI